MAELPDSVVLLIVVLGFGLLTLPAWACAVLARRRHRWTLGWFVAGLVFHFVAVLVVALLPDTEQHCPRCKERFDVGASHCAQYGHALPSANALAHGWRHRALRPGVSELPATLLARRLPTGCGRDPLLVVQGGAAARAAHGITE